MRRIGVFHAGKSASVRRWAAASSASTNCSSSADGRALLQPLPAIPTGLPRERVILRGIVRRSIPNGRRSTGGPPNRSRRVEKAPGPGLPQGVVLCRRLPFGVGVTRAPARAGGETAWPAPGARGCAGRVRQGARKTGPESSPPGRGAKDVPGLHARHGASRHPAAWRRISSERTARGAGFRGSEAGDEGYTAEKC